MENCGTVPDLSLWKKKKNEGMGREKKTYGLVGSFSLEGEGFVSVELVKVLVRFEKVSEGCWHFCLCVVRELIGFGFYFMVGADFHLRFSFESNS